MPQIESTDQQYSSWVGLIYVYNLIVGTGALTLPAVFARAGWLLSTILLTMLAFIGFVTVTFIVEALACANAIKQFTRIKSHKVDGESEMFDTSDPEEDNVVINETETETLMSPQRSKYYTLNERIELGEMTQLFFNKTGKLLFYVSLCVYLYGDLAIYAAAISRTLSDLLCEHRSGNTTQLYCSESGTLSDITIYRIILITFVIIVGPFSYFNIQKTKYLQLATSSMRWCAFLLMISIALVTIIELGAQGHPPVSDVRNIPSLIGVSVYSFMCHHSLPGLVAPFADKSNVTRLLGIDYILICLFYILLAFTGAFAFEHLEDLYTLNFVPVSGAQVDFLTKIVEYFLTLFPVFTLSTNFPIIAITLQNNLKCLFLDTNALDRYNFFVRHLLFPTLAIVPPVLVAFVTHNLDSLVSFTGTYAGSVIQYLVPVFLVLFARKVCIRELGVNTYNKFGSPFQGGLWLGFVIIWCFTCVMLSTLHLFAF